MSAFRVWQQLPPIRSHHLMRPDGEYWYEANLLEVGTVEAPSVQAAIEAAKDWPQFRYASGCWRGIRL